MLKLQMDKQAADIEKDKAQTAKTMADAEGQTLENLQTGQQIQREQVLQALMQAVALLQQPNVPV